MLRRMLLTVILALSFPLLPAGAANQGPAAASEDAKTRLNKRETIDLMLKIGRMPRAQQDSRMDQIAKNQSDSKTPRSDFEFCMGLAYRGNYKAQACAAKAYEHGLGIVEDLSDAYVWYVLALENRIDDAATRKLLEEEKERLILKVRSTYPSPSDDELQDLVRAEKNRLTDYRNEAAKEKK
jgi:TPR repeat protein